MMILAFAFCFICIVLFKFCLGYLFAFMVLCFIYYL